MQPAWIRGGEQKHIRFVLSLQLQQKKNRCCLSLSLTPPPTFRTVSMRTGGTEAEAEVDGGDRRGEREREGGQEIGIPGAARICVTHCATSISREVEGKSPSILSHKCAHAGVIRVKKKTLKSNEKLENPCGKWCKRTKRQKGTNFLPM